ncbi:glycosyltransferase family 2 protein [Chromobacterium alticapitis]|uniref:glycosyltransferase family 2 protein n=1 Tax=Chromobacterium alticapitis TaxID=2073169 RepID=UPI001E5AFBB0|nr:glycosyltransferase family 2 protein [Chromobacterium alticapitis]
MPISLGIAIITKNAAAHLADCLASVREIAADIVIVDSGSQDATLEIAERFGAQVFSHLDWPGFGIQKARAVSYLQTDWILSLDADEVLTPELASAIVETVSNGSDGVYSLSRLSNFCGRWMHHSGWRPDHVPRLFRRGMAAFSDDLVHEKLLFAGAAPVLRGDLLHYSYDGLDDVLDKLNRYSSAGARQRHAKGKRSGGMGAVIGKAVWSFLRTYIVRRGFLDGREGFVLAVANAEGTYYRQLKLLYLSEQSPEISN